MLYVLYTVVIVMIPHVLTSPFYLDKDAIQVNVRLINEIHSPRFKRSFQSEDGVTNLPDHLVFGVPVKDDKDAILRLKRKSLVPTITSSARVDTGTRHETKAVYTDMSHHSTMIVRRDAGMYSLQGTFHDSGKEWNLQPLSRNSRSSNSHKLSPIDGHQIISFAGDTRGTGENVMDNKQPFINFPGNKNGKPTQHVVEVAFIVDYADYSTWVDYVGSSNAIDEMTLWYTFVAESMNIRYNSIKDDDIAMATRTTILKIITDDASDDFLGGANGTMEGEAALEALEVWVPNQVDLPSSDHYMLFTGLRMADNLAGLAYVATLCSSQSLSIVTNFFQANVGFIAAHEVGHSLFAWHDDQEGCDDSDQYIMAAVLRTPAQSENTGNQHRFSSCSIRKFKGFLSGHTCTLPENTSDEDVLPAPEEGERAGEVLSLDDQCIHVFQNTSSFYCSSQQPDMSEICRGMFCYIPGTEYCEMMLPQEFSTCGKDKWCSLGYCVDKYPEPKLSECFIKKWRTFFKCLRDVIKSKTG